MSRETLNTGLRGGGCGADPSYEADMDDRHHALGRPLAGGVSTRNHFVIDGDCDQAKRMRKSPAWHQCRTINAGADAVFIVTPEGEREVHAWLTAKDRASGYRTFRVEAYGLSTRHIRAKSRSAARYKAYLQADFSALTFGEFISEFTPRAYVT